jgi:Domain of unknown function (DUF4129)
MTRAFTEAIAALADHVRGGVPTLVFLSLLVALLVGIAWYFWPRWLPWNWGWRLGSGSSRRSRRTGWRGRFRLGSLRWRLRLRWRRRRNGKPEEGIDLPADELPDLPAEVLVLTADQLAAAGRFKEAVRERLRAMVRELIEKGIIPFSPGWTVTELAAAASNTRPALAPPLGGAVSVFSEIWYGLRPALLEDDTAMRAHAAVLTRTLNDRAPVGS